MALRTSLRLGHTLFHSSLSPMANIYLPNYDSRLTNSGCNPRLGDSHYHSFVHCDILNLEDRVMRIARVPCSHCVEVLFAVLSSILGNLSLKLREGLCAPRSLLLCLNLGCPLKLKDLVDDGRFICSQISSLNLGCKMDVVHYLLEA